MMLSSAGILDKAPRSQEINYIIVMPPFNIDDKPAAWRSFGNGATKGSPFLLYAPGVSI